VQIWGEAGDAPVVDLLVGTSPNYRISNVRRQGENDVFEVMGLSPWDLRADSASWIQRKFVDVPFDTLTAVKLKNAHGALELRKQDGQWVLAAPAAAGAGTGLDQGQVDALVRAFPALSLAEPAGKLDLAAQGLAEPAAVVELVQGGSALAAPDGAAASGDGSAPEAAAPAPPRVTTLTFGAEVPGGDGKRYASRSGFDHAVVLNKIDAERATDKKLADLRSD
jgi:hypothetical protein